MYQEVRLRDFKNVPPAGKKDLSPKKGDLELADSDYKDLLSEQLDKFSN